MRFLSDVLVALLVVLYVGGIALLACIPLAVLVLVVWALIRYVSG
jgi:hypothetical protein